MALQDPLLASADGHEESWSTWARCVAADAAVSAVFWYLLLGVDVPGWAPPAALAGVAVAMLLWRFYRSSWLCSELHERVDIPYTCGHISQNGRELFLVATVHISPRAPRDVKAVIDRLHPDITMIELDEERLDRMRDVESRAVKQTRKEDLQLVQVAVAGAEPETLLAQRALWNAEHVGERVSGPVHADAENEYGLRSWCPDAVGKLVLVRRGSANGEFSPFALKAHTAARAGASAVLVIDQGSRLPPQRLGGGALVDELRIAMRARSCGLPRIPLLLLAKADGERLLERCRAGHGGEGPVHATFEVMPDKYPRRSLRRRLCQSCAMVLSGIGILYGIIQCFAVDVGAEFIMAEQEAAARGIPCVCIDVDMNRFWGRLGMSLMPVPSNICNALIAWLALPRVLFRMLFPSRESVDVVGSSVLHAASFPVRTWIAFVLAGWGANLIMNGMLQGFSCSSEEVAEDVGAVPKADEAVVQSWMMLLLQLYILPRVYAAVAEVRDEAMYQSIVAKSREHRAKRLVVVVGAAHSNGILQRVRTRGL